MLYTRRRKECPMGKVYPPEQPGRLREIQAETLARPRRSYSTAARLLFVMMDVIYGKAASLRKYRVLEIVARVPYQAWENVAYVAITRAENRLLWVTRNRLARPTAELDTSDLSRVAPAPLTLAAETADE